MWMFLIGMVFLFDVYMVNKCIGMELKEVEIDCTKNIAMGVLGLVVNALMDVIITLDRFRIDYVLLCFFCFGNLTALKVFVIYKGILIFGIKRRHTVFYI